jgi:hypothetical protein
MNPLHLVNQVISSHVSSFNKYDGNFVEIKSQNQKRSKEKQAAQPVISNSALISQVSTAPIYKDLAFKKLKMAEVTAIQTKDERAGKPSVDNKFDQVVVVEVFSSFSDGDAHSTKITIENEMIGNVEAGLNLARRYHPNRRYIWSVSHAISQQAIQRAHQYGYQGKVFNLTETSFDKSEPLEGDSDDLKSKQPFQLTPRSKLIIVAQGNPAESKIADLEAEAFIEMLQEDLGVTKLAELELMVCYMGRDHTYLTAIKNFFELNHSKTCITSYTALLSTSATGEIIAFNQDANLIHSIDQVRKRIMTSPI